MRRIRISRLQHLVLDAGSGLYSLAGHNADLLKARHIIASLLPGSYTLAGNNATLTRQTRLLNTLSGTYSYVGSPATLTWATSPNITTAPVIIGIPTVGTPVAYTAGNVTGSPVPTRTQQWLLDGNTISGATGSTYTPITSDAGHNLAVRQIETNTFGSANRTSAGVVISSAASSLGWTDNIFPMTIIAGSFFDLQSHITSDVSQVASITPNVALPSGVAITNTPTWRITATSGATLGNTTGLNLTIVPSQVADFQNRISGPGVVWYHSFDTAAEVNQFRWTGGYSGGNDPLSHGSGSANCFQVPTGGVDGGGFLRLQYPLGSNQGSCYWWRPFNAFTGATNGRGVNDPGANGTITPIAWPVGDGTTTTLRWSTDASNPAYYGTAANQAANPTKFQGNDFYFQVRIRRAQTPGPPPDNVNFQNITGKSIWPNVTTNTSTTQELVTYGQSNSKSVIGVQDRHRLYEGVNRSGTSEPTGGIGGSNETDTVNNSDGINDWSYSGGWDTLTYHITPGSAAGTGANRTRIEVWAQHDLTLFPAESGQHVKIWDVLYSADYDTGTNTSGGVAFPGWNALILAIYHNGSIFTTTTFNYDYDQVIFSKNTIPAPTV